MIVDAILYNGERDIFDLRYNILKDYVDEFVVVEFGKTFSGNDKEAHPINLPKVSYHFFTQIKDLKPNLPPAFAMEYNQREMIKECLTHLDDEDILAIGDCDEIWKPMQWRPHVQIAPFKMKLRVYSYFLNNLSNEDFTLGTVIGLYKHMKLKSFNELRSKSDLTDNYYGWHFTSMGGVDKLKEKIESYGHQEFNIPEVKDNLETRLANGQDYIGRDFKFTLDESDWPAELVINREKYRHLIKE